MQNDRLYETMTSTPVSRLIIKLGIPTTISMLVTNIYNMADTYFVSSLGTSASGAVGIVFGLMAILQAFGFMFGHGAGSIISRKLGEKDAQSATLTATASFFSALIFGGIIGLFGLIFTKPLMYLLGSTPTILPYASKYAFWILLAAPLMTASFVMNNILRYEGKASLAMIGLTAGGILNIFGDYILMRKFDMGIEGAGISTAVSQAISFSLLLSVFLAGKTKSKFSITLYPKAIKELKKIIPTGLPSLIRQGLSSISTMLLNYQAGIYGDAAIAAMTIVNRICFFVFAIGLGIGQGFQPVCGFNYGAKKYTRVKKGFFFTLAAGEIFMSLLAVIGLFLSDDLVGIFRDDPSVMEIGTFALKVQLLSLFFQPLCVCCNMMFQSIGKNRAASFLSALRSGLIFIPAILILPWLFGLTGVEITQPVTDVAAFLISLPFVISFFKELPKTDIPNNDTPV